MNKTLLFLMIVASIQAMGQSNPDTTLVDKNAQRVGELKSKLQQVGKAIEDEESKEVSNYELLQILQSLDRKVSQIAMRQDSMIAAGRRKLEEEKAANARKIKSEMFYLVIESHLSPERASIAMANHDVSFEDALVVGQSTAGRWYYVILADGVSAADIRSSVAAVRKKIPTAWYIAGSKLKE